MLFVKDLIQCNHCKAKEIGDKNELMTLDLNGIELNASNYLWVKPFWKQTTKDISMEIN